MPALIKLIAGLGNPGQAYSVTRHNAGFWYVDRLVENHRGNFSSEAKFFSELTRLRFDDVDCRLIKPTTFMNESGRAVQAIIDYYKFSPEEILVAHDEIDLDPGIVRLKNGGGHGGHNGVRDIINSIGSNNFLRLRIGVGHPGHRDLVIDSVLSRASAEQQVLIDRAIQQALDVMPLIFNGEFQKAMNELHKSEKPKDENEE